MNKHTPGPWMIEFDSTGDGCLIVNPKGTLVADCWPAYVASNQGLDIADAETYQANTNLIAAAPDLFEALEIIACITCADDMRNLAEEAIAKVTGE